MRSSRHDTQDGTSLLVAPRASAWSSCGCLDMLTPGDSLPEHTEKVCRVFPDVLYTSHRQSLFRFSFLFFPNGESRRRGHWIIVTCAKEHRVSKSQIVNYMGIGGTESQLLQSGMASQLMEH